MTATPSVKPAPVVGPVLDATLSPPEPPPGALLRALREDPKAMVYFLNVGDGDTQLLLLPPTAATASRAWSSWTSPPPPSCPP